MINIKHNNDTKYLEIKGHAGYDQHGKDIVCAAVSALFFALVQKLMDDEAKDLVKYNLIMNDDKKKIEIIKVRGWYCECVDAYFDMITNALCMISKEYSDYIKICDSKKDKKVG